MWLTASTARVPEDILFSGRLRRTRLRHGLLYLRGDTRVLEKPTLGIVGSRECSAAGLAFARAAAHEASSLGLAVISGGARGIDAAAHRGAIASNGLTAMVLATPLDQPSPSLTRVLGEEILHAGGLVLSEYADGEPVHRAHFLERNRIVAALSDALFVTDARESSGALATARHAKRLGREIWVTPGAPWDEHGAGCNALLRDGARPITSLTAFRDALEIRFGVRATAPAPDPVLDALRTPRTLDEWSTMVGLDIARACRALFELVVAGKAIRLRDGRYVRRE
jgi:DNA processing protein